MADSRAREVLSKQSELEDIRRPYETVWEAVAEFCDPDAPDMWSGARSTRKTSQAEHSERRGSRVYDNTINHTSNNLTAGLESLTIPQSEKWHGISTAAIDDEETDEEIEWAEDLRDLLFSLRYNARSNFVTATQACLRNVVRYGPAYLYAEEGFDGTIVRYSSIPVWEAYISRNRWGVADTFHRQYQRSARQCAQLFGYGKLPPKIRALVDDPAKCEERITLVQSIRPSDEKRLYRKEGRIENLTMAFASLHVIEGEEVVVKDSGFRTFPIAPFNWRRYEDDEYGISPTIEVLTTVREINAVRRTALRALQQTTDPATASRSELDFVPVLNPGQNYPGLIDDQGRQLIAPINVGQDPRYAFEYAGQRAEDIRDAMFVKVFQTMLEHPDMTATAALIRQEEKGQLLGPAGSIIQAGFASNLDRELDILEDAGLYEEGSRYIPPQSLAGKTLRPTFTSPLDVLRKAAEARDTEMLVMKLAQYAGAKQDPAILDNVDDDEYARILKGASRAPQKLLRTKDEVAAIREGRQQATQAQAGMGALMNAGKLAKDAVPAAIQARDSGILDGMMQAAE